MSVLLTVYYLYYKCTNSKGGKPISLEEDDYLEYKNLMEFYNWVLTLKPKDVRDDGISERELNLNSSIYT